MRECWEGSRRVAGMVEELDKAPLAYLTLS